MKSEAPTEAKIEALRDEGIVAISPLASHCLGIGGGLVVLCLLLKKWTFSWPERCVVLTGPDCAPYVLSIRTVFQAIAGMFLAYFLLFFAATLAQTRGYFRFQFTRPSFGQRAHHHFFTAHLASLVFSALFIGAAALAVPRRIVSAIQAVVSGQSSGLLLLLVKGIYLFSAFCAAFGSVCWLVARLRFLREHRMSRAEILQEGRQ